MTKMMCQIHDGRTRSISRYNSKSGYDYNCVKISIDRSAEAISVTITIPLQYIMTVITSIIIGSHIIIIAGIYYVHTDVF